MVPESPVNSESSPGRGYAEAYQRIVEEENLAHEDSIEEMEEMGIEDVANSGEDEPQEHDRLRAKHRSKSGSPRSLHTLRKTSPRVSMASEPSVEEAKSEHEALDQESVSDLAPTENETQTSGGSGSSQYARDLQRLNNALRGNGQPFSRARVGQKGGSVSHSLRRSNGSDESLGSTFSSGNLSHRSDPSVNIPKAWGRKAKPGKDWLNRINSQSGRLTGDAPKESPSSDQLIAQNDIHQPDASPLQNNGESDAPLRRSPSMVNGSSRGPTPRMTFPRNTPWERKPQWGVGEDEFTGRSLQVSESPPMRIRNTTHDNIEDQEVEENGTDALDNDNFSETIEQEKKPKLLPFEIERESLDDSRPGRSGDGGDASQRAKGKDRQKGIQWAAPRKDLKEVDENTPESIHDEIGEAIPDTPVVVFKKNDDHRQSGDRKPNQQGESENLLRRLARVSSQSPSPAKEPSEAIEHKGKETLDSKLNQTPHQSKAKLDKKTPVVTGAWIDQTPGPNHPASESKATLKTPFITGGWIDTPLPTGGRGPPMPTPSEIGGGQELGTSNVGASDLITKLNTTTPRPPLQIQEPLKYTGPPLPKSALEEIINDARSGKLNDTRPDLDTAEEPTLHLGDSTIQSLEDLIANDTDYSTILATSQETSPPSSDPSPSSKNASNQPTEPQDPQSYTNLLSRLRNLGPSIRASTRQLASLERTVSTTAPKSLQRNPANTDDSECHEAGEFHDIIWPCPRCNCPGRPSSTTLTTTSSNTPPIIPLATINLTIPALWYYRTPTSRLPRPTTLGALVLTIYLYCVLEHWAQLNFCQPRFARSWEVEGYGVDIHAPRPPFVLFKVIYRKAGLEGVWVWVRAVVRVVAGLVGWVMGFVLEGLGLGGSGPEAAGEGVGKQPVSRDERIPRPKWGPDLSMFDDEFL